MTHIMVTISQLTNMARKQLQNNHIVPIPFHPLPLALFEWTNIYGAATVGFCEYGGTQNRLEYDEKPADMPPMVFRSIVGIRPCHTLA